MSDNVTWHPGSVTRSQRKQLTRSNGLTVWMTGLSGAGKSTIARLTESVLIEQGVLSYVLDGDNLRHGLNSDLGFGAEDRAENIRRVGELARVLADAGLVVLVPVISPFGNDRRRVRQIHEVMDLDFREVFVRASLATCELRDPKGLYTRARAGEVVQMTGIDSPYEPPEAPDLLLDSERTSAEALADRLTTAILQEWSNG